jgi:hypothetical protein
MDRRTMTKQMTGTREEWLAGRLGLLREEKELTARGREGPDSFSVPRSSWVGEARTGSMPGRARPWFTRVA